MSEGAFPEPPDGGWGWVVVCSCFMVTACTRAVTRCITIFFVEFQEHFSKDTSTTSWINSIMDCTTMLCAPFGSLLSTHFGCRPTVMFGGLVSSSGFIIASFSPTIELLYVFLGLVAGLGFSLCYSPSIAMVSHYFRRRRLLAMGLAMSGSGVGTFVLAPVVQLLIEVYAWRGALLLLGAFVAQLCVCGALLRPLASPAAPKARPAPLDKQPAETRTTLNGYNRPPVLCEVATRGRCGGPAFRPELPALCLSVSLMAYGCVTPLVYLVPFAHSVGTPERQAAFLLSLFGIMDIVGTVTFSWLSDRECLRLRRAQCFCVAVGLYGACALTLPAMRTFPLLIAFATLYGYLNGACTPLVPVLVADLVDPAGASTAIGIIYAMHALPYLLGPPTTGWLVDTMADYNAAFFLSGSIIVLASATFALATCATSTSLICSKGHLRGLKPASGLGNV